MKQKLSVLFLSMVAMFLMVSCDNDDDNYTPDAVVRTVFKAKYPNAKRVEWESKLGYSVAEFKDNGKEKDAWFDANGTWLLTETDITVKELPQAIRTAIAGSKYAGWKIDDADYLERKDMEPVYVVEVEQGENEMDLYYSPTGVLLKEIPDGGNNHQAVPTPVNQKILDAVMSKYADAQVVEIDVEPAYIEVDLMEGNLYFTMILDKEYNWIQSEYDAAWIRVPEAVKTAFANDGYTFNAAEDEVEMIIRPQGSEEIIIYCIELDKEPKDIVLYYTSDGVKLDY